MLLDSLLPHLHPGAQVAEGHFQQLEAHHHADAGRHAAQYPRGHGGRPCLRLGGPTFADQAGYTAALALALGIGIQNFPEGAAISLPLRQEGFSRFRSFVYGMLSGIVEPVFGILVVLAAGSIQPLMPWLLGFAAGAMMYVVVEELIPEAHLGEHSNVGTLGVMGGFLVMMVLDVALG